MRFRFALERTSLGQGRGTNPDRPRHGRRPSRNPRYAPEWLEGRLAPSGGDLGVIPGPVEVFDPVIDPPPVPTEPEIPEDPTLPPYPHPYPPNGPR